MVPFGGGSLFRFLSHQFKIGQKFRTFGHFRDGLSFFRQGACWADLNAFPAAGAGLCGTPGLIEIRDDSALDAAAHNVPGVGALDVFAYAYASKAENTTVVVNGKPCMRGIHFVRLIQVFIPDMGHSEGGCEVLQFTVAVHHADRADMVSFREDKLQYFPTIVPDSFGIGDDLHLLRHKGNAGGKELGAALDFNNAQAASPPFGQTVQMTQGGDMDVVLTRNRQNGLILATADSPCCRWSGCRFGRD